MKFSFMADQAITLFWPYTSLLWVILFHRLTFIREKEPASFYCAPSDNLTVTIVIYSLTYITGIIYRLTINLCHLKINLIV